MSMYVGANNVAHKIPKAYVGVNGVARKITAGYVGVNGVARRIFGGTVIKSFATATDEEITSILDAVRNGDISVNDLGWSVGDERSVHLSAMAATGVGESHVEQDQTLIILHGSDVFDLVDGGKNLFVIGLKNVLANGTTSEGGYINSTDTNVGGWKDSARRSWCDNVFMKALPTEVQKWFKKFKYLAGKGNKSTETDELENYFTFASRFEAFGNNSYTAAENTIQFDYYKTQANRIKCPGDSGEGYALYWFLRSASTSNTTNFSFVGGGGTAGAVEASWPYGLSPFGCI